MASNQAPSGNLPKSLCRTNVASTARSRCAAILLVGLSVLCFNNDIAAEVITNHAGLYGSFAAHFPIGNLGADTYFVEGDSGITMDHSFDNLYQTHDPLIHDKGSLRGEVHAAGDQLFRLYAGSSSTYSGTFDARSQSFITASWRDVTYVTGAPPASIRLQFQIDGSLFATTGGANEPSDFAGSMMAVRMFPSLVEPNDGTNNGVYWNITRMFETLSVKGQYELTQYAADSAASVTKSIGFDSATGPLDGHWSVTYEVPYDATYGGYAWSLWAAVGASAASGVASSEFGHTFRLTDILDSSGNSIASSSSFDSGLVLVSPVPEPSTYAMALAGLACGGWQMWRRRRAR